ncbi:MAG: (Fe-S)-binding protein [Desulfotalea sp.]
MSFIQMINDPVQKVIQECVSCGLCVKECSFLQKTGDPRDICENSQAKELVFSCNLCGLCKITCPKTIDIPKAFLELRRQKSREDGAQRKHLPLQIFQSLNSCSALSLFHIPDGCDTVFFPGCSFTNNHSNTTEKIYRHLSVTLDNIGLVLTCCSKPSYDLGLNKFDQSFAKTITKLKQKGVKEIITACANCFEIFKKYATDIKVTSLYQTLSAFPPPAQKINEDVIIHDSCVTRNRDEIHNAVRELTSHIGGNIFRQKYEKRNTVCCGEGGAASFSYPEAIIDWSKKRREGNHGKMVITYCAGCQKTLQVERKSHILDLLFNQDTANYNAKRNSAPFSYIKRFLLKHRFH